MKLDNIIDSTSLLAYFEEHDNRPSSVSQEDQVQNRLLYAKVRTFHADTEWMLLIAFVSVLTTWMTHEEFAALLSTATGYVEFDSTTNVVQ